jgi:hypothetical protein
LIDRVPQTDRFFNEVIESTSLNGLSGVSITRLSNHVFAYNGEIWWLPLRDSVRENMMNQVEFYNFVLHQEHKPYDVPQAIKSALDTLDEVPIVGKLTHNVEDFSKFFCSELVAAALEKSGVVSHLNSSEVTPIDLCRFSIYKDDYYQLKGKKKLVTGYNTLDPVGWGE